MYTESPRHSLPGVSHNIMTSKGIRDSEYSPRNHPHRPPKCNGSQRLTNYLLNIAIIYLSMLFSFYETSILVGVRASHLYSI